MGISKELEDEVQKALGKVVGQFGILLTEELVQATPVQTGHARSNWIPSIGSPYPSVVGSRDAVDYSVQQQGLASLESYKLDQGNIYVANNVDYIEDLNQGTSPQAPAEFVQGAVDRAIERLK